MGRKEDFLNVLTGQFCPRLPLWELHFHIWNLYSKEPVVLGADFLKLDEKQRSYAIDKNAEIMAETVQEIGFGAVSIPDAPWDCWYTLPQKYRVQLTQRIKALNPDFAIVAGGSGVLSMPSDGAQYVEFYYRLFDAEEEIDQECENIFSNWLEQAQELAQAGLDAMYIPADVADNRTTFFNRAQLERWYFPYLRQCAEEIDKMGMVPILHTDGNITTILPDLLKTGIKGLQAIDPVAGMDIQNTKKLLAPQITVCGNVDCGLMLTGSPDQVYEATAQLIRDCFDGQSFILGNSNAVAREVPQQNYDAYLSAWRDMNQKK